MAVQPLPWAIQGQSHSAEVGRSAIAALLGAPITAFANGVGAGTAGGSHGVVNAGDLAVSQNGTPNMSVNVAAGRAAIRAGNAASILAGAYTVLNDGVVNVAIGAADPTNPRIDLVVIQVRDTNYSEAANDVRITVVAGTPNASPVVPSLASFPNALVLAEVRVNAAVTSITNANITDRRTYLSAVGAPLRCLSTNRPSGASLATNVLAYELDTGFVIKWNGSAWVYVSASGTYTPTLASMAIGTGGSAANTASWAFSDGEFQAHGNIVFGTTGATFPGAGAETISMPAGFTFSAPASTYIGQALLSAGGAATIGTLRIESTTTIRPLALNAAGTHLTAVDLTALVPGTWAAGDTIRWAISAIGVMTA